MYILYLTCFPWTVEEQELLFWFRLLVSKFLWGGDRSQQNGFSDSLPIQSKKIDSRGSPLEEAEGESQVLGKKNSDSTLYYIPSIEHCIKTPLMLKNSNKEPPQVALGSLENMPFLHVFCVVISFH